MREPSSVGASVKKEVEATPANRRTPIAAPCSPYLPIVLDLFM
jgi:hypothetical protein